MSIRSRLDRIAEAMRNRPPDPNTARLILADALTEIDLRDRGRRLDPANPARDLVHLWCGYAAKVGARRDGSEKERVQRLHRVYCSLKPSTFAPSVAAETPLPPEPVTAPEPVNPAEREPPPVTEWHPDDPLNPKNAPRPKKGGAVL